MLSFPHSVQLLTGSKTLTSRQTFKNLMFSFLKKPGACPKPQTDSGLSPTDWLGDVGGPPPFLCWERGMTKATWQGCYKTEWNQTWTEHGTGPNTVSGRHPWVRSPDEPCEQVS